MDSASAFIRGEANRGNRMRVFDWNKAAERISEVRPGCASAGLQDDWEWTGGDIYTADGIPDNSYTYLCSTWAIPELDMDGDIEECWVWKDESPGWDADSFWPGNTRSLLTKRVDSERVEVPALEQISSSDENKGDTK